MFWYEGGMLFTDNLWQQSSQIWGQSMQWWEHWCKRYLNCGRDGVPPSFPVCPFRCGCQVTIKALENDFLKFTVGESPYANPLCSCHSRLMRMRKRRVSHLPQNKIDLHHRRWFQPMLLLPGQTVAAPSLSTGLTSHSKTGGMTEPCSSDTGQSVVPLEYV